MNKRAMHGTIIRTDGTTTDFSWLHCCRNNITKLTDNTLSSAMRQTVKEDIMEFKREQQTMMCNICKNKELPYSIYEVDHVKPSFKEISDNYIKLSSTEQIPTTFSRCTKSKANLFSDKDKWFEKGWKHYHRENANYQILCMSCNRKKH